MVLEEGVRDGGMMGERKGCEGISDSLLTLLALRLHSTPFVLFVTSQKGKSIIVSLKNPVTHLCSSSGIFNATSLCMSSF